MTTDDFVKLYNKTRKANKNKWFTIVEPNVCGYDVKLKGYNTWIQVMHIGTLKDSGLMDVSVKSVNQWLINNLAVCDVIR